MKYFLILLTLLACNPADFNPLQQGYGNATNNIEPVDFIPAVQPFVNEGCNTTWDNLSAIWNNGQVIYFTSLPAYTNNPTDLDQSRFSFIYQVRNPWYGLFEDEAPYARLQTGWRLLPIDDYGIMTCGGVQELRIWVRDKLTDRWYMNSQVCWAGFLCNGQGECSQGYEFSDIEYTTYSGGFLYLQDGAITEN